MTRREKSGKFQSASKLRHGVRRVVFASSVDDPDTGYALTADQVSTAAREGAASGTPVDTGSCATR